MSTFELYRFSPDYLREAMHSRLAWSVKLLLDAWPSEEWNQYVEQDGERFFHRMKLGCVDGCDFVLHNCLLQLLLADQFVEARYLLSEASRRSPKLDPAIFAYGSKDLAADSEWYKRVFEWNDLEAERLCLCSPQLHDVERCVAWMSQVVDLLRQCSPKVYAEFQSFRPLWLIMAFETPSELHFMGYSSSLAWGTIGLNVDFKSWPDFLVQVIHELAHQLLFALALEVPLVFNAPDERYHSPLRIDRRPMDGVLHACFVSARSFEVLNQIKISSEFSKLETRDQALIVNHGQRCLQAALAALPTIKRGAQLSALGERVVQAIDDAIVAP